MIKISRFRGLEHTWGCGSGRIFLSEEMSWNTLSLIYPHKWTKWTNPVLAMYFCSFLEGYNENNCRKLNSLDKNNCIKVNSYMLCHHPCQKEKRISWCLGVLSTSSPDRIFVNINWAAHLPSPGLVKHGWIFCPAIAMFDDWVNPIIPSPARHTCESLPPP